MKDVLTKAQAAELLQVSERQVQRLIADKKLRASRVSHKVLRIQREDVLKMLQRAAV